MDEPEEPVRAGAPSDRDEIRRLVSNNHALLRSIMRRSADSATSLDSYVRHLEGRLDAIGRILLAAVSDPAARFDLRHLIEDELDDQRADGGQHSWSLDGPPVAVDVTAA